MTQSIKFLFTPPDSTNATGSWTYTTDQQVRVPFSEEPEDTETVEFEMDSRNGWIFKAVSMGTQNPEEKSGGESGFLTFVQGEGELKPFLHGLFQASATWSDHKVGITFLNKNTTRSEIILCVNLSVADASDATQIRTSRDPQVILEPGSGGT